MALRRCVFFHTGFQTTWGLEFAALSAAEREAASHSTPTSMEE
jgi:hypothetical protein